MYLHTLRPPDAASLETETGRVVLCPSADNTWAGGDAVVQTVMEAGCLRIILRSPGTPVRRIALRWKEAAPEGLRILGDHWERGYGDLEWRGIVPERVLPWYALCHDGKTTAGIGVRTGPNSFCSWSVDSAGVWLHLDVRCGGRGVVLGDRALDAATVVWMRSEDGESPFAFAQRFCRGLCPKPILPDHPIYGGNDWYYSHGNSTQDTILRDTARIVELSPGGPNHPYMVIDAGWERYQSPAYSCSGGSWLEGNAAFPDMPALAAHMKRIGTRPGIWVRPLGAEPDAPESLLLPVSRARDASAKVKVLDPSLPEIIARTEAIFRRMRSWGFELIKHDWTSCDIFGRWGFDMGREMTNEGWSFADRSRTTAEIMLDLFAAIRRGAGGGIVIGCNTTNHLAAGMFAVQRTGDDTSGQEWERTRKMGINTLAMRMPQHNAFFAADADCVGLTRDVPWALNRQWLDVLARSGTPLFVSAAPDAMGPEQVAALRDAFAVASQPQPPAEPLDWCDTTCPTRFRQGQKVAVYQWTQEPGV